MANKTRVTAGRQFVIEQLSYLETMISMRTHILDKGC